MLLLIVQNVLSDGVPAVFLVVAGADNISCVALFHELGAEAAGEIRHIVQMGMYRHEYLAPVRLAGLVLLDGDFGVDGHHSDTACSSTYFRMLSR